MKRKRITALVVMLIAVVFLLSPAVAQSECQVVKPTSASVTMAVGPDPDNLAPATTNAAKDTGIHVVRADFSTLDLFISGALVFPAVEGVVESATLTFNSRGGSYCKIGGVLCDAEARVANPVVVAVNGQVAATAPFPATRVTTVPLTDVSMFSGQESSISVSVETKAYPENAILQWIFGGPDGAFAPAAELEVCTRPEAPDPADDLQARAAALAAAFPGIDIETILLIFSLMGGTG